MSGVAIINRALRDVEVAAREVDALFGGQTETGNWYLDGSGYQTRVYLRDGEPLALALLILHDCLNTVEAARSDPETVDRYYRERDADGNRP